jgi:hypothetical protein
MLPTLGTSSVTVGLGGRDSTGVLAVGEGTAALILSSRCCFVAWRLSGPPVSLFHPGCSSSVTFW